MGSGIAVGMATNVSHNLGEIVDGLIALIKDKEISDLKLSKYFRLIFLQERINS